MSSAKVGGEAEWKPVQLNLLEQHPLIKTYLPQNLTEYALNRIRYSVALAFRDYKVEKSEMGSSVVILKRDNVESEDCVAFKVKLVNNYLFCTCFHYFNTGLPCEHQLVVALTQGKKFLVH